MKKMKNVKKMTAGLLSAVMAAGMMTSGGLFWQKRMRRILSMWS